MTTTIGMHYDVLPGKEEEFQRGFEAVQKHLQQAAGHVESKLYVDTQSPGSYLIFSQWKSKEDFERFLRSPEFANVTAWGKAEILRDRPRHKIYQTP